MGTRYLVVVVFKTKWVIAQVGQYDGYPEGAGVDILTFLVTNGMVAKLRVGLEHTYVVDVTTAQEMVSAPEVEWARRRLNIRDEHAPFSRQVIESLTSKPNGEGTKEYAGEFLDILPSLYPVIGCCVMVFASNATAEKPLPVILSTDFANDGLFCEYAYVVDLDQEVFEVYGGHCPKSNGHRFQHVGGEDAFVPSLMASFAFADLAGHFENQTFLGAVNEQIRKNNAMVDEEESSVSEEE